MILTNNLPIDMKNQKPPSKKDIENELSPNEHPNKSQKKKPPKRKKKKKKQYDSDDEEELEVMSTILGLKQLEEKKKKNQMELAQKEKQQDIKMHKKEKKEIKRVMEEEKIPYMDEEDREKLTEIDSLIGQPREDDIFLFAIPVCAPYSCLKNYKYKVKMIPGAGKRGKVGKEALQMIKQESKYDPRQEVCIKAIDMNDVTITMVGNSRIASAKKGNSTNSSFKKKSKRK
jgi:hypothetical protein